MKLAKDTVGNFANLRPDNPGRFIESVACVLEQYPLGIGQDCADPVNGIASKVEFLSIKTLKEWCDERRRFYEAFANYVAIPQRIEGPPMAEADMKRGGAALRGLFRAIKDGRDLKSLSFEDAIDLGAE